MRRKKQSEKQFMDESRMEAQKGGGRLFRNNNGVAEFTKNGKQQRVKYGLGTGTSDLIGWTPMVVTQEMVGGTVAVFTAAEGKRGRDKLTDRQRTFMEVVHEQGGIALVFGSPGQLFERLTDAVRRMRRTGGG